MATPNLVDGLKKRHPVIPIGSSSSQAEYAPIGPPMDGMGAGGGGGGALGPVVVVITLLVTLVAVTAIVLGGINTNSINNMGDVVNGVTGHVDAIAGNINGTDLLIGDSLVGAVVEVYMAFLDEFYNSCSGTIISNDGVVLTAAHCFLGNPMYVSTFDSEAGRYPIENSYPGTRYIYVGVQNINGTTERRTFPADLVAVSWTSDVAVLQIRPMTPYGTGCPLPFITVVNQTFALLGNSSLLKIGTALTTLTHENFDFKKTARTAHAMVVNRDSGFSGFRSVERVFYAATLPYGTSGAAMFDSTGQIMGMVIQNVYGPIVGAGGPSGRVIAPIVDRMRHQTLTPPEVPSDLHYLIPTLGIAPFDTVEFLSLFSDLGNLELDYLGFTQDTGIIIDFFLDQDAFDFLCGIMSCTGGSYTASAPSVLGAPVDTTILGTPPDPLSSDIWPTGTVVVMLKALERTLDQGDWYEVGDGIGLESISGVLIGSGKWAGDVVRVRFASFDFADPTNPATNWDAIYRVTLRAMDPFYDTLYLSNLLAYSSKIHVDTNSSSMYLAPGVHFPNYLSKRVYARSKKHSKGAKSVHINGEDSFATPPEGMDVTTLPTIRDLRKDYILNKYPARRLKHEAARARGKPESHEARCKKKQEQMGKIK